MTVDPDRLAELEEERAFLLRSLDDLERERAAGDLDDADYEALQDSYTARAAAVLREIDQGKAALPPPRRRRPAALVGGVAAVVALAVGAGVLVAQTSGRRAPGDTLSGDVAESINANLAEARSLQSTDPVEAIKQYDEVLAVDPDNVEALTYRGWLLVRVGSAGQRADLVTSGEQYLDRAVAADATYADAQCFKAITRFRAFGDAAGAKPFADACLAADPPQVVLGLVQGLAGEIDAALAGVGAGGPTTPAPASTAVAGSATTAAG